MPPATRPDARIAPPFHFCHFTAQSIVLGAIWARPVRLLAPGTVQLAPVPFGRPPGPSVAGEVGWLLGRRRRRWAVVDITAYGHRSTGPFLDDGSDLKHVFPAITKGLDSVAGPDHSGRLGA